MAITILLIVVSVQLALTVAGTLGVFYGLIYWRLGRKMNGLGQLRKTANIERYQITTEIFGGIKELKVLGREQVYLRAFEKSSLGFARAQTLYQTLSDVPRYLIEALGFCTLFVVVFYTVHQNLGLGRGLPLIGLYAFAGYRLLPAAQSMYAGIASLRFCGPVIDSLHADIVATARDAVDVRTAPPAVSWFACAATSPAKPELHLSGRGAPDLERPVAHPARRRVDRHRRRHRLPGKARWSILILGLLTPTERRDRHRWRAAGARADARLAGEYRLRPAKHLPRRRQRGRQHRLRDREAAAIDQAALERAARLAHIHDFIAGELAARLRDGDRRARRPPVRRPAPAARHRARPLPQSRHPDFRRSDQRPRHGDGGGGHRRASKRSSGRKPFIMIAHRLGSLSRCDILLKIDKGQISLEHRTPA